MDMQLEKNFISLVIYVRNNEKYIKKFFNDILNLVKNNFEKFEIIIVNDFSTDNTIKFLKEVCKSFNNIIVSIINLSYYQGKENSILAGVDASIGDFVFEFDSIIIDYPIELIMDIYNKCLSGFDIVSASPENNTSYFSKIFYKLFKKYSKNKVNLQSESFRIISRRGINRIGMLNTYIPYRKALYFNCGLRTKIIKYKEKTIVKKEKIPYNEKFNLALTSLIIFTDFIQKLSGFLSIIMFVFSILTIIYTLIQFSFNKYIIQGWTTIMLFTSIAFTFLFFLIYVIIKYLSIILYTQHTKQDYVFDSIEKIKEE